MSGQNLELIRN